MQSINELDFSAPGEELPAQTSDLIAPFSDAEDGDIELYEEVPEPDVDAYTLELLRSIDSHLGYIHDFTSSFEENVYQPLKEDISMLKEYSYWIVAALLVSLFISSLWHVISGFTRRF